MMEKGSGCSRAIFKKPASWLWRDLGRPFNVTGNDSNLTKDLLAKHGNN